MQEVLTKEEKTEINNYLENLNEIKSKYGSLSFQDFRKQRLKREAQNAIFDLVCIKIDKLFQKLPLSKLLIEFVNIESDLLNISCKIHNLLDLKQIKSLEKEFNTKGVSLYEGESYVSGFYNTSLIGIFGTNFNKNIGENISIEDFIQEVKNIRNFRPFNGQKTDFKAICEQFNSINIFRVLNTYKESSKNAVISSLEKYKELMNEYNKKFNELIEIKNELIYKNVEFSSLFLQDLYVLNTYITATKINNDYCVCAESRRCEDILKEFGFYSKDQEKLKENPLLEIIPYVERVLVQLDKTTKMDVQDLGLQQDTQQADEINKVQRNYYNLSPRQIEIVDLIIDEGLEDKEIANRLTIATVTASTHVSNILKKLELKNRTQIANKILSTQNT